MLRVTVSAPVLAGCLALLRMQLARQCLTDFALEMLDTPETTAEGAGSLLQVPCCAV